MARNKRKLTLGETIFPSFSDSESRVRQIVVKKNYKETIRSMYEYVQDCWYKEISSPYDCSGEWFTEYHELFKYNNYWIVRLYEFRDL